jgi:hypothetical protein
MSFFLPRFADFMMREVAFHRMIGNSFSQLSRNLISITAS